MNNTIFQSVSVSSAIVIFFVLASCNSDTTDKASGTADEKYYEKIPLIDAYYQGKKVWFIHTGASSKEMAERLTKMVDYPTYFVPQLKEAVDLDKIAKIYVFKNGVDQSEAEPWGGGPFNFQIDMLNAVPGDSNYSPLKNPHLVIWNETADARILESEEELLKAEKNGELTVKKTDVVVNAPVVRWPGKK
jgi:phosphoglucomutase